jgi:hypothetical protein
MGDLIDNFHSAGTAAMPLFGGVLPVRGAQAVANTSRLAAKGVS